MHLTPARAALVLLLAFPPSCATLPDAGEPWLTLFDGRSLDGWVTRGGRYDGNALWTVEGGALVGRQGPNREGGLIYTDREFADVELELDVQVDHPFDSGIFLRMVPDERGLQLTIDDRPEGEIGALYSDGYLQHCFDGASRFERGGWNHFRVELRGRDLELRAWLNGQLLAAHAPDPTLVGFAPRGRIGLQVHGGEDVPLESAVRFRNIRARELRKPDEPVFTADTGGYLRATHRGLLEGWRPLFDGQSLDGWERVGGAEGCQAADGLLSWPGGQGWLATARDYRDFELRLDFQFGRLANSGVFLRAPRDGGDPAYSGCEVQILDDFDWEIATEQALQFWQFTGSLYGAVPPGDRSALRPAGLWNTFQILCQGTRLRTVLNGVELYDVDTSRVDAHPPFAERAATGAIGLQCHGAAMPDEEGRVTFRNLFVRPL